MNYNYKIKGLILILAFAFSAFQGISQTPVITNFSPLVVKPGTLLTINGSGFSSVINSNQVDFGDVVAAPITASTSRLVVSVPFGACYGNISVLNKQSKLKGRSILAYNLSFAGNGFINSTSFRQNESKLSLDNFQDYSNYYQSPVITSDFDRDGIPDVAMSSVKDSLIVANNFGISVATSSSVNLGLPVRMNSGSNIYYYTRSIDKGDLNADGYSDIVVTNPYDNTIYLYIHNGISNSITTSTFSIITISGAPNASDVKIVDVNGDGKDDLISVATNGKLFFYQNNYSGIGLFTATDFSLSGSIGGQYSKVAVADFNNDSKIDFVLSDMYYANLFFIANNIAVGSAINMSGLTTFAGISTGGSGAYDIITGDFDGNGKIDVAQLCNYSNNVIVAKNNSSGFPLVFNPVATITSPILYSPNKIDLGEINGDGKPDFAISNSSSTVLVKNNSTPNVFSFSVEHEISFDNQSYGYQNAGIKFTDFNLDGKPDLGNTYNEYYYYAGLYNNFYYLLPRINTSGFNPVISSIAPSSGLPGTIVTINGQYLNTIDGITLGAIPLNFKILSGGTVLATIPSGAISGNIGALFKGLISSTTGLSFTVISTPIIYDFNPKSGNSGDLITIDGVNFSDFDNYYNVVYFGPTKATTMYSSYAKLVVKVPQNAGFGPLKYQNAEYTNYKTTNSLQNFIPTYIGSSNIDVSRFVPIQYNTLGPVYSLLLYDLQTDDDKPNMLSWEYNTATNAYDLNVWENNTRVNSIAGGSFIENIYNSTSSNYIPSNTSVEYQNADAYPDLVFNQNGSVKSINGDYYNNFTSYINTYSSIQLYIQSDFNLDGKIDILSFEYRSPNYSLVFYSNNGSGYDAGIVVKNLLNYWTEFKVSDIDNDGDKDIIGLYYSGVEILTNNCNNTLDGSCLSTINLSALGSSLRNLFTVDLNKDNLPEIGFIDNYSPTGTNFLKILRNNSSATNISLLSISGLNYSFSGYSNIEALDFSDLNGDSKLDIVILDQLYPISRLTMFQNGSMNSGSINITNISNITFVGTNYTDMKINDMDGDYRPDIIISQNITLAGITIFKNNLPGKIFIPVDSVAIPTKLSVSVPGDSIWIPLTFYPSNASDTSVYFDGGSVFNGRYFKPFSNGVFTFNVYPKSYGTDPYYYKQFTITVTNQNFYVTDFSPLVAKPNDLITLKGNYFNLDPIKNRVTINGLEAEVLNSDRYMLQFKLPYGVSYGPLNVTNTDIFGSIYTYNQSRDSKVTHQHILASFTAGNAVIDSTTLGYVGNLSHKGKDLGKILTGDINADRYPDIIIDHEDGIEIQLHTRSNQPLSSTSFSIVTFIPKDGLNSSYAALYDINRDGNVEVVYIDNTNQTFNYFEYSNGEFIKQGVYINSGNYILNTNKFKMADVSDDGKLDIIAVDTFGTCSVYEYYDGDGTSFNLGKSFQTLMSSTDFDITDLNKDGYKELIVVNNSDSIGIYDLIDKSKFPDTNPKDRIENIEGYKVKLKNPASKVAVVDIDANGVLEVIAYGRGKEIEIINNSSTADSVMMSSIGSLPIGSVAEDIAFGDFNGDQRVDMVVGTETSSGDIIVVENKNLQSINLNLFTVHRDITKRKGNSVAVADLDMDTRPDFIAIDRTANFIQLFRNNFPADTSFKPVTGLSISSLDSNNILSAISTEIQMVGTIIPANATDPSITWRIVPPLPILATISGTGLLSIVTTTENGVITVMGISNQNNNITSSYVVTIIGKVITSDTKIVSNENLSISGVKASPCLSTFELSIPEVGQKSYQWYYNDLKLVGANTSKYNPVVNGSYYVIALDTIAYKYLPYNVSVDGSNLPQISGIGDKDTALTSNIDVSGYQWYVDDIVIKGANAKVLRVWYNGRYYVVTKNDATGCKQKSNEYIVNRPDFKPVSKAGLYIKDSVIYNYGYKSYADLVDVKIYPNPTSGIFTIEALASEAVPDFQLLNTMGEVIETGTFENISHMRYIARNKNGSYPAGIYFIKIGTKSIKVAIK